MQRDGDYLPFVSSGSYPIRAGNAVRPLVDGGPAFARICEAVANARRSVWVTVAFHEHGVQHARRPRQLLRRARPRAGARRRRARDLLAPRRAGSASIPARTSRARRRTASSWRRRGSRFLARWDHAHGRYCQHQKSWLVDAGQPGEVAFVGGINLNQGSVVAPGHAGDASTAARTTCTSRCAGPRRPTCTTTSCSAGTRRATATRTTGSGPTRASQDLLRLPAARCRRPRATCRCRSSAPCGASGTRDGTPPPAGERFAIERRRALSIFDQYLTAIDAARAQRSTSRTRRSARAQVVDALHARARPRRRRGRPRARRSQRRDGRGRAAIPKNAPFFEQLAALGQHDHFALVGHRRELAAPANTRTSTCTPRSRSSTTSGATIGSANIGNRSFFGDTELNASFWHAPTVRALRRELLLEHLGRDTRDLDARAALRLYRDVAREKPRCAQPASR